MANPDTRQEGYVAVVCGGQAHQVMMQPRPHRWSGSHCWRSLTGRNLAGDKFTFTIEEGANGTDNRISVNYDGFIDDVSVGDILLVDGGIQSLMITAKSGKDVHTEVVDGGTMKSRCAQSSPPHAQELTRWLVHSYIFRLGGNIPNQSIQAARRLTLPSWPSQTTTGCQSRARYCPPSAGKLWEHF